MIRGLGYLKSLNDLESIAVGSKNGTPVLLRDLGSVAFDPDIREGVAEWTARERLSAASSSCGKA